MVLIKTSHYVSLLVLLFVIALFSAPLVWGQNSPPVRLSLIPFLGEAPAYIAVQNRYFKDEGLDVTVIYNSAGKIALQKLFEDKVDIVTVADTPIVYKAFNRDDFYILAGMTHTDQQSGAIARKDQGINTPAGIKGRRVAWFQGTGTDYLLDQYLLSNGLTLSDIETVDLKPKAMVKELISGNVDAIFSWQPHIMDAVNALGDKAYILPTKGLKVLDWVVVTRKEFAEKNPKKLEKYLSAIIKANQFILENPDEAMTIYAKATGADIKIVSAMWEQFSYGLFLNESMLINMEDQARWIVRNKFQEKKKVPNYLSIFHVKPLMKVKPEAVTLIK
ncbi:MAG: ABC transporter substrate-binding protein [Sneathiella sp.]|nr:ABC transporter substrate-binding protein [Sneathiella sp.]